MSDKLYKYSGDLLKPETDAECVINVSDEYPTRNLRDEIASLWTHIEEFEGEIAHQIELEDDAAEGTITIKWINRHFSFEEDADGNIIYFDNYIA